MTAWVLKAFSGEQPRISPNLLPANSAQSAVNSRLDDGALTPMRRPLVVGSFPGYPGGYKTIYRDGTDWLGWTAVVNVVPGPVASDRLYITGDGAPKMKVAGTTYDLAVPFPAGALTATLGGAGAGDVFTRLYVYTYVTDFGEESEPCPASNAVNWQAGNTVTLSGFAAAPAGRNITKQRIYRTQTGDAGTDLYFIAERAASAANYVDSIAVDAFGEVIPSRAYAPPPAGLAGLVAMPNGMMAAFNGRDVYFCEPWIPHAWPEAYVLTVDYDIVGLGAIGTSLVILTKGNPYLAQGTDPSTMQMVKMKTNLPCVNARGIVDLGTFIAYPSHEGLVTVSSGGMALVATEKLFNRQGWQAYGPATYAAGQLSGRYLASYNSAAADGSPLVGTLILNLTEGLPFVIRSEIRAEAFFYDLTEGALFYLTSDGNINQFDPPTGQPQNQYWRSKVTLLSRQENFGAILIDTQDGLNADEIAAINDSRAAVIAANTAALAAPLGSELDGGYLNQFVMGGDGLATIPALAQTISVNVIADGELVATVSTVNKVRRLPSGFKARKWEVEAFGSQRIQQIALGSTVSSLMDIQAS